MKVILFNFIFSIEQIHGSRNLNKYWYFNVKTAVNFWLGLGVDGFYLRDVAFLYEDVQLTDESQYSTSSDYAFNSHNMTRDLAESYQTVNDIFIGTIQPRLGSDR